MRPNSIFSGAIRVPDIRGKRRDDGRTMSAVLATVVSLRKIRVEREKRQLVVAFLIRFLPPGTFLRPQNVGGFCELSRGGRNWLLNSLGAGWEV